MSQLEQNRCGHNSTIYPEDCLGLVLGWTTTHGSMMALQLLFGMTVTNLLMYVHFNCRLIIEFFNHHHLAKVSVPSKEKSRNMNKLFMPNILIENVCCAMDGLKLYLKQTSLTKVQKQYYNEWLIIL